ncbi:sulfotransferase [Pontimonas sp.]|nr:sulfotransferase [Pontimonas sp.]
MCSERSGSNLITKIMNGHKDICGPSTKHILNPLARNLFRYGDIKNPLNWEVLLGDVHHLLSVDFSVWKKSFSLEELRDLVSPGDVGGLVKGIFREEAFANGKTNLFIKENQIYRFAMFLGKYFPEARFVYQTRDPRDMALSWKKNPSHRGGVVEAARQWRTDQQQSLMNFSVLSEEGRAHFLKYENLIMDPMRETSSLLHFLGLPADEKILDFNRDPITLANAQKISAWGNLQRGVIADNFAKFKAVLTDDEIRAVETICFYEMRALEYQTVLVDSPDSMMSAKKLEEMHAEDSLRIRFEPEPGVEENMAAKKAFYTRSLV